MSYGEEARVVARGSLARLRRHDLVLCAAGVTFYAAISAVPGMFVALRVAAALTSPGHVVRLGADLAGALPQALGAPDVVRSLFARAAGLGWWQVAVALFPASLYGEGLRRALVTLGDVQDRLTGWRGRLALLPVLAVAPALLLALLAVTPRLGHLFGEGGWAGVLGVVIAFTTDWLLVSGPLVWVFRVVGGRRAGLAGRRRRRGAHRVVRRRVPAGVRAVPVAAAQPRHAVRRADRGRRRRAPCCCGCGCCTSSP